MGICFVYLFFTIFTVKYGADKAYFGIAILPLCQHIVQSQQKRNQDNLHDCCFKIFSKLLSQGSYFAEQLFMAASIIIYFQNNPKYL